MNYNAGMGVKVTVPVQLSGMRPLKSRLLAFSISFVLIAAVGARGSAAIPMGGAAAHKECCSPPVKFVTRHQVSIRGTKITFTATAGETYLYNDAGEPIGSIFSYAYVRDATSASNRPVLFLIGGGPGAASFSLNIGFGPWGLPSGRLALKAGVLPSAVPPFGLVDNPDSLMDVADLVFIDPVGTGYSRILGVGKSEDFWNTDPDLESIAQFMQRWLSANNRWNSPKFILGESYGGTRAALLPNFLMGGPDYPGFLRAISLNGVIVLVNTLGYPLGGPGIGSEWLSATALPNQAAAAWYHHKIDRRGRSLVDYYKEVTAYSEGAYADALRKEAGKTLAAADRAAVVAKLVEYTGLPPSAFAEKLALNPWDFSRLLLADQGKNVSVFDSRYTLPGGSGGADPVSDDALLARSFPVMTGAFLRLEREKLKVTMDREYAAIRWRELLSHWTFERRKSWSQWQNVTDDIVPTAVTPRTNAEELAIAMARNDRLYAMVATGYFDLQMPPSQARLAIERAHVPSDRLIIENFEAGHEVYVDDANKQLVHDIREMIIKASR